MIDGLAGRKDKNVELFDVVTKLIGPVQPVGETYADHARLENMKALTELTERLIAEIRQAASCADRHEASMAKVGKYARDFLADMTANA